MRSRIVKNSEIMAHPRRSLLASDYLPRRVYILIVIVWATEPAEYVTLDIPEGTLEEAIDHFSYEVTNEVWIIATGDDSE